MKYLSNLFGPWTYLNLNHLNSTRFKVIQFTTDIQERDPVVKWDPTVYV